MAELIPLAFLILFVLGLARLIFWRPVEDDDDGTPPRRDPERAARDIH